METKIVVKEVKSKDGKKTFKTYKVVDSENHNRLIDAVICKSVDKKMVDTLNECNKATVTGNITINTTGFEFPKAFVKTIDSVEKIN